MTETADKYDDLAKTAGASAGLKQEQNNCFMQPDCARKRRCGQRSGVPW